MNSPLKQNTITIQNLLNKINELPEAGGGVELPELTNEGSASDLLSGKQLINGDGNVVTGTIPTQAAKTITPSTSSQTAVASGRYTTGAVTVAPIPSNYEDVATETTEYTSLNDELEDVINSLPNAEDSSGDVETCTVNINCIATNISAYITTKIENGESVPVTFLYGSDINGFADLTNITLKNIACNTVLFLCTQATAPIYDADERLIMLERSGYGIAYRTPSEANAIVTINVTEYA